MGAAITTNMTDGKIGSLPPVVCAHAALMMSS